MTHAIRNRIAAGVLVGGVLAAAPAAAFADTPSTAAPTPGTPSHPTCSQSTFSVAQQFVEQQLSNRVAVLDELASRIGAAPYLTASDRTTLQGIVSGTQSGIGALVQKVPSDTTCAQLWSDARSMVVDYRVYAVVAPQSDLTIVADTESSIAARLAGLEPQIQQAITAAQQAGKNTSGAQAAFDDFTTQVSDASTAVGGVAADALSKKPADYQPGMWIGDRTDVTSARADLHHAVTDARTILKDLQG